jgi:hypothetical protein
MLLPHHPRIPTALTKSAALTVNDAVCADAEVLRDGCDRDNLFVCKPGDVIAYRFDAPVKVDEIRIIFDSDLDRVTLPGDHVERNHTMRANLLPDAPVMHLPTTLCKSYTVEVVCDDGSVVRFEESFNLRRLVLIPVGRTVREIRLAGQEVHEGGEEIRLFSFEVK